LAINKTPEYLKGVPKSHIYRVIRKGEVRVNKGRKKADYKLQIDDVVRIPPIRQSLKIIRGGIGNSLNSLTPNIR
jgi:23S rRNA-/tRNA-specific pseudouridylate synthase